MSNLTYGEFTEEGLNTLLENIDTFDKNFYDLGSGKGEVVINAINAFPDLKKSVGIEIVEERHQEALSKKEKLNKYKKDKVYFLKGDITSSKFNLKDANLIYISNLCFDNDLNNKLANKISEEVSSGTLIFSSKNLPLKNVDCTYKRKVKQSWTESSTIFVNRIKK